MIGEGAASSRDVRRASAVQQGNGEIAQSGEHLGSVPRPQLRAIFAEGDIAHVMQAVLNVPMAPYQGQEAFGTGLRGGKRGDEVHGLLAGLAGSRGGHLS